MNYDDIIRKTQEEAAEKQAAQDLQSDQIEAKKQQDIARAKRQFSEIIVSELEKARLSLVNQGHHAEVSNGDTRYGPRRCLRIDRSHRGSIYGIVFQLVSNEPILRPELRCYQEQDGLTPKEPLDHSKMIGIGADFTCEQVQESIAEFLKSAI